MRVQGQQPGLRIAADARSPFQSGGTLRAGALYITRRADEELPEAIAYGDLPYVLAPRQMGKSSLRVRTEARLRAAGVRCASVDLSALGSQDIAADAWYYSLADELSARIDGPDPAPIWRQLRRLPVVQRLLRFVRRDLLGASPEPLVIFLDEIDSVLSLPFPVDDLFAGIRSLYNARAEDPSCAGLSFCMLGVATPAELMQSTSRTPFNVGRSIRLEDFTREESRRLAAGLGDGLAGRGLVADTVFDWTEGHPYMTQRLCEAIAREGLEPGVPARVQIARIVGDLFLQRGRVEDLNLASVERLFSDRRLRKRLLPMLELYLRLLDAEHVVAVSDDPVQAALRMAGVAAERDDGATLWLRVRNPIVGTVFDHAWVEDRRRWLSATVSSVPRKPRRAVRSRKYNV